MENFTCMYSGNQCFLACSFCLTSSFVCGVYLCDYLLKQQRTSARNDQNTARLNLSSRTFYVCTSTLRTEGLRFSRFLSVSYFSAIFRSNLISFTVYTYGYPFSCVVVVEPFLVMYLFFRLLIGQRILTLRGYSAILVGCALDTPACMWSWMRF